MRGLSVCLFGLSISMAGLCVLSVCLIFSCSLLVGMVCLLFDFKNGHVVDSYGFECGRGVG